MLLQHVSGRRYVRFKNVPVGVACCANLMSVAKNRFDNLFGEACARLDRGQYVREAFVEQEPLYIKLASALMFNAHKSIKTDLNALYADDVLYTMHWRKFMTKMIDYWRDTRLVVSFNLLHSITFTC